MADHQKRKIEYGHEDSSSEADNAAAGSAKEQVRQLSQVSSQLSREAITGKSIVEAREESTQPRSFTLHHFWKGVRTGQFCSLTEAEQQRLLQEVYQRPEPLTKLTGAEEKILDEHLHEVIDCLNTESKKVLAENDIVFLDPQKIGIPENELPKKLPCRYSHCPMLIDLNSLRGDNDEESRAVVEFLERYGLDPLTPPQKVALYTDPKVMGNVDYVSSRYSGPITSWGVVGRGLRQYGYHESAVKSWLDQVRESTGRKSLKMLDVGGGLGKALQDFKEADPDIETYNLVLGEDTAYYAFDHLLLCQAERMPRELEEQMDIIISDYSFRNFTYPDLALRNVLKSLSVGGCAQIDFSTEKSFEVPHEELNQRIERLFAEIRDLASQGLITARLPYPKDCDPQYERYRGKILIEKKQSLKGKF